MKDLQELIDSIPNDELRRLNKVLDKKKLSDNELASTWNLIIDTYNSEMNTNITEDDMTGDQIDKLYNRFKLAVTLSVLVRSGHFKSKGRLSFINEEAEFARNEKSLGPL